MRPEDFATKDCPLRGSALTALFRCAGSKVGDMIEEHDDTGGKAAHSGTAVGRAIEVYHATELDFDSIMDQVKKESNEAERPFPKADWGEVGRMFRNYTLDSRNPRSAVLPESLEEVVELELPPHELDPTGKPVYLTGHLDQVRFVNGTFEIWDLKAGKPTGWEMLTEYAYQQVVYASAYKAKYPERKVAWGGIIRLRDYLAEKKRVPNPDYDPKIRGMRKTIDVKDPIEEARLFYHCSFAVKHYKLILDAIRLKVAMVRAGKTEIRPHAGSCRFCVYQHVDKCTYWLEKKGFLV